MNNHDLSAEHAQRLAEDLLRELSKHLGRRQRPRLGGPWRDLLTHGYTIRLNTADEADRGTGQMSGSRFAEGRGRARPTGVDPPMRRMDGYLRLGRSTPKTLATTKSNISKTRTPARKAMARSPTPSSAP